VRCSRLKICAKTRLPSSILASVVPTGTLPEARAGVDQRPQQLEQHLGRPLERIGHHHAADVIHARRVDLRVFSRPPHDRTALARCTGS
jgi:hypothetical protein